ncbi:endocuticle structural glycoprotein SgAbd-5-like [Toxorhynchites rutilus septentrionalis]|uniref:endocuticle structural glycoprotein SgAbd-5-like n=1 Tax=Toxorhynchites rutilus septentrionalis TaxID=329112 RepID=UPI0024789B48|nr:endocuticle structural glycoprotein SgAbd-5-like [Toxorhynchites rutilus septentrionalis]
MKFLIAFLAVVAVALAGPIDERGAQIVKYTNDHQGISGYNVEVETSNGIRTIEQAELRNLGNDNAAIVVRGSYSYTGDDGQVYTVNYIADENGFQPEAAHLPRA